MVDPKTSIQLQRITITADQLQAHTLHLTPEQSHYLRRVLRLGEGDRFIANGPDHPWLAVLSNGTQAQLLQALPPPPPLPVQIHLLAALPKTGFDEVVRQATELGVGEIWPILSDRTLLKPSHQKLQRWQRIAEEASEQCERARVPPLHPPQDFASAIAGVAAQQRYLCAARSGSQHLLTALRSQTQIQDPAQPFAISLATGPEGGWTEQEINQAIAQGYSPVSLGPTILRAVTAPLAAISLILGEFAQGDCPPGM